MHPALIRLRPATAADRPQLSEMHLHAFRAAGHGTYDPAVIDGAARRLVAVDPAMIADGRYWLIEAGGAPVASAGWSAAPPPWITAAGIAVPQGLPWVRCMHIHPRMTGAGLGTRLLATIEQAVRHAGHAGLAAWVPLTMIPLYRSAGFAEDVPVSIALPEGGSYIGLVMARRFASASRAAA